jgi:putative membrane protein
MNRTIGLFSSVAAAGAFAFVASVNGQSLNAEDRAFMENTAKVSRHEVHMGELGLANGSSTGVKGFSQRLVNDHKRLNEELDTLAKQKAVTLPPEDPSKGVSLPLSQKTGTDFDITFAREMVEGHQQAIAAFEREVKSGSDPEVKSWAEKSLPILKAHLTEAQSLVK